MSIVIFAKTTLGISACNLFVSETLVDNVELQHSPSSLDLRFNDGASSFVVTLKLGEVTSQRMTSRLQMRLARVAEVVTEVTMPQLPATAAEWQAASNVARELSTTVVKRILQFAKYEKLCCDVDLSGITGTQGPEWSLPSGNRIGPSPVASISVSVNLGAPFESWLSGGDQEGLAEYMADPIPRPHRVILSGAMQALNELQPMRAIIEANTANEVAAVNAIFAGDQAAIRAYGVLGDRGVSRVLDPLVVAGKVCLELYGRKFEVGDSPDAKLLRALRSARNAAVHRGVIYHRDPDTREESELTIATIADWLQASLRLQDWFDSTWWR